MRSLGAFLLLAAVLGQGSLAFRFPFLSAHGNHSHDSNHTGHHGHHGPKGPFSPKFEVVNKTFSYEVREYKPSSWVITNSTGWSWETSLPGAVKKLLAYTHGANQKDKHFHPSKPLLTRFVKKTGSSRDDFAETEYTFTNYLYLPRKPGCNATLPTPISKQVEVLSFPAATVYSKTFPGFAFSWDFKREAFRLAGALGRNKVDVREGIFIAALYSPPFQLFHRRNEVWFAPKPKNSTGASLFAGMQQITSAQLDAVLAQPTMKTS